jgi:hypothetical protein
LFRTDTGRDKRVGRRVICPSEAFDNFPPGLTRQGRVARHSQPTDVSLAMRQLKIGWLRSQWLMFGQMAKKPVP